MDITPYVDALNNPWTTFPQFTLATNAVTTSSGDLLVGIKGAFLSVPATTDVYAIVGSGTQGVSFMEVYE